MCICHSNKMVWRYRRVHLTFNHPTFFFIQCVMFSKFCYIYQHLFITVIIFDQQSTQHVMEWVMLTTTFLNMHCDCLCLCVLICYCLHFVPVCIFSFFRVLSLLAWVTWCSCVLVCWWKLPVCHEVLIFFINLSNSKKKVIGTKTWRHPEAIL
jgi:hypothetical protein